MTPFMSSQYSSIATSLAGWPGRGSWTPAEPSKLWMSADAGDVHRMLDLRSAVLPGHPTSRSCMDDGHTEHGCVSTPQRSCSSS